ncbi:CLUMA_CG002653, isoform A [Clunio marinus]|uniref:CLUMA_CG002653, isoform A n=1 Tax=Clunio marinus TaxID=568069 RepID=A0A1J1HN53_9DIPT|nr:CLUMA_CG002653, isoform A [Clunio marinus]
MRKNFIKNLPSNRCQFIRSSDASHRLLAGRSSTTHVNTLKSALKANNVNPTDMLQNEMNITHSLNSQHTTTIHSQSPIEHQNDPKTDICDITKSPYIPVYKHNYVSPLKSQSSAVVTDDNDESTITASNYENDDKELTDIKEDISEDEGEQFEYTDDDLDEALADHDTSKPDTTNTEQDETSCEELLTPVNTLKSIDNSFDISEGHYLPMTPKKAILSSSASETSILAMDILNSIRSSTDAIEENPYIEMSSGMSEMSVEKQVSPYELVMVSGKKSGSEPLYMELSQNAKEKTEKKSPNDGKIATKKRHTEKSSSRIKKRHDLPDILKQSQQSFKSDDSSDADDEDVSKEPLTMKSRTRFSLSDTFRPASYYLGASTSSSIHKNLPLAECLDSSDSEIVAPPPIPTSPPPLDSEEIFSSENFNTIKRNSTTSNEIIHHRTMSASSVPLSDRHSDVNRTSRLSLQDQLFKQQQHDAAATGYLNLPQFEKLKNAKLFSTASNCSINTDDGSNTSSDFDLYNKIKLQSPSISADSLNQSQSSLTESPRPRPLPLSDDSLFKLEDEQNANEKLDHYLNKLETSDLLFSKEQTTWLTENLRHMPGGSMDPTALHYENINMIEQQQKKGAMYYDSLEDVSNKELQPLKEKNLSIHDALHDDEMKNKNYDNAVETSLDADGSSTIFDMTQPSHSRNNSNLSDSAPYYYSDLTADTIQKLNNQRDVQVGKKNPNYISHIQNLINNTNKQQLTSILKDQAEKEQGIDSRNLYESGSGRLQKLVNKDEPTTSFASINYYHEKNTNVDGNVSTSIDNLLYSMPPKSDNLDASIADCDQLWEEDAIWCESLRRVSQRHARSLDDLDRIESLSSAATKAARISDADRQWGISSSSSAERKSRTKITRDVTYVNEDHQRTLTKKKKNIEVPKMDENDVYVQLACAPNAMSDVYEILRDDGSNIDRENIRQWDLMSSGLVKSSSVGSRVVKSSAVGSSKAHTTIEAANDSTDADHSAVLILCVCPFRKQILTSSVSVRNIRNIPKVPLTVKPDPNDTLNRSLNGANGSTTNSYYYDNNNYPKSSDDVNSLYINGQTQQRGVSIHQDPQHHQYAVVKKTGSKRDIRENLERENSAIFKNHIRTTEGQTRAENLAHLEKLKHQLSELEKQYEKSKPLVNLVDNMVKLGSLYRGGSHHYPSETTTLDRLEFNQRIQERRLMQEEQRQWERMSPNQTELQTKVQQLYKLDQALQEESGTLQSLQRDKEDLERALFGLRSKLQNENAPSMVVEAARRQQHVLEMELSRVHQLLAENSKKLEQTVASNARLEQELLVLRQKLQQSRDTKNFQSSGVNDGQANGATAVLESELRRVQQLVGDMQRQRQELSQAVRELTDNSNSIYQEMNRNASGIKKRTSSTSWTETDLDSIDQIRLSFSDSATPLYVDTNSSGNSNNIINCSSSSKFGEYEMNKILNGRLSNGYSEEIIDSMILDNDDLLEGSAFSNLSQQDKQEIKTVRIVKRESQQRQRDRERTGYLSQNLDQVLEEEAQLFNNAINSDSYNSYQRSKSLPRTYMETHEAFNQSPATQMQSKYTNDYYNSINVQSNNYPVSIIDRAADLYSDSSATHQLQQSYVNYYPSNGNLNQKTESIQSLTKMVSELSPVFQSEAARQIIIEMSGNSGDDDAKVPNANKQRRAIPKEKRRHFTAPHHVNAKTVQTIQFENDMNKNNVNYRARDDLDMEVALRPRINAPDVVRSALGPREKISENTIDNLFGAPNKILIPERYIPEQAPELSPEEKKRRQEKVEAIKKMLSETTPTISANDTPLPPSQISAEKKQREHLLQLNQILAQQVMQMSKIVADKKGDDHYTSYRKERAMAGLPSRINEMESEREQSQSPVDPLPIYQQRDNFFT